MYQLSGTSVEELQKTRKRTQGKGGGNTDETSWKEDRTSRTPSVDTGEWCRCRGPLRVYGPRVDLEVESTKETRDLVLSVYWTCIEGLTDFP